MDKQGLTWLINKDNRPLRAGDEIMYDIPDSTEDAERREQALGPPEGGTRFAVCARKALLCVLRVPA